MKQDRNDELALSFIRNMIKTDSRFADRNETQALHLLKVTGHYDAVVHHVAKLKNEESEMSAVTADVSSLLDNIFKQ